MIVVLDNGMRLWPLHPDQVMNAITSDSTFEAEWNETVYLVIARHVALVEK